MSSRSKNLISWARQNQVAVELAVSIRLEVAVELAVGITVEPAAGM